MRKERKETIHVEHKYNVYQKWSQDHVQDIMYLKWRKEKIYK